MQVVKIRNRFLFGALMALSGKQKNYLRGLAHKIHPVVTIGGNGLSQAVLDELEIALTRHELLKIKLPATDKASRASLIATLCAKTNAIPVQIIGRVGVVYRESDEPKIALP